MSGKSKCKMPRPEPAPGLFEEHRAIQRDEGWEEQRVCLEAITLWALPFL